MSEMLFMALELLTHLKSQDYIIIDDRKTALLPAPLKAPSGAEDN